MAPKGSLVTTGHSSGDDRVSSALQYPDSSAALDPDIVPWDAFGLGLPGMDPEPPSTA